MKKKAHINYSIIILMIAIFGIMLILNMNNTFVADDFNNMFIDNNTRFTNIFQVIKSQEYRYYNTNGRVLAHVIGATILIFKKGIINIINSIGFCALLYILYRFTKLNDYYGIDVGYKHCKRIIYKNRNGRHTYKTLLFLVIFLLIWKFTPVFGQDFLWVIGAANYMWTNILIFSMLLCARKRAVMGYETKSTAPMIGIIVLSFFAGMTNENSVPAAFVVLIYYIVKMFMEENKELPSLILMFLSSLAGFIIMITAPGNFVRITYFKESDILLVKYFNRLQKMNANFGEYFIVMMIVAIIFILLARLIDIKKNIESEMYFLAGMVAYYAMVMAPTFPPRSMVFTVLFFTVSIIMNISIIGRFNIRIAMGILIAMSLYGTYFFVGSYSQAIEDCSEYMSKYSAREIIIKDSKNMGRFENIEVPAVESNNPYCAAYKLEDCLEDKNHWINVTIARYYGVNSVVLRKNK